MDHKTLAEDIVSKLSQWGAYIYYEATTGSIYIKFPHWGLGSIRIGDHKGIQKYRYRYRLRTDRGKKYYALFKDRGVWCEEFGPDNIDLLVTRFELNAAHRGIKPGDKAEYKSSKEVQNGKV